MLGFEVFDKTQYFGCGGSNWTLFHAAIHPTIASSALMIDNEFLQRTWSAGIRRGAKRAVSEVLRGTPADRGRGAAHRLGMLVDPSGIYWGLPRAAFRRTKVRAAQAI